MSGQKSLPVVIVCCFFYAMGGLTAIVAPTIAAFQEIYPDASLTLVQQISTLPSLLSVPVAIIAGATAGKQIKFKTYVLLSCLLMAVGGALPFLFHDSLIFVLVCRCVFGIGFGIMFALMGTIIVRSFSGEMQAKVLGWAASSLAVTSFALPLISGYLTTINPHYVWPLHLITAVLFILVLLFFPEPKNEDPAPVEEEAQEAPVAAKAKISAAGWVVIILFGVAVIAYYPLWIGSSTIVVGEGLGTAVEAGWVISIAALGQFIAGLIFAKYYYALKKNALPVAFVGIAVGLLFVAFGNLPMIFVGSFICGFTFSGLVMSGVYRLLAEILQPGAISSANGWVGAFANLGAFICPFWMAVVAAAVGSASPRPAFGAGAIVLVICAAILVPVLSKAFKKKAIEEE